MIGILWENDRQVVALVAELVEWGPRVVGLRWRGRADAPL